MAPFGALTQARLWDCRRETAIQASKKERKKRLFIARQAALRKRCYQNATGSPAVREIPRSRTWDGPRARFKGVGAHQAEKIRLDARP